MTKLWICLLLAWLLPLGTGSASCFAAEAAAESKAGIGHANISAAESQRQVLVMLHLPPPHFRPDASYSGRYTDDAGHSARRRIAEDLARAHGLKLVTDWPMPALGVDCYVMEQPAEAQSGMPTSRIAELLSHDPRVEWAQPMGLFHGLGHSDPLYPVQPNAKYWHLSDIHKVATGRNVLVAVVDSGVEDRHPDLAGQVAIKENFVDGNPYAPETHGTAVAGIIAAHAGNGMGIEGVAPDAHLMALRACWQSSAETTQCSSFTLSKALNFAIMHDAQVINMSLSGPPDRLLQRLLDVALGHGIKLVGAVDPNSKGGGFPASYPGVLAVSDQMSDNRTEGVFIAPGQGIPTTVPGARWNLVSGSSYAAAHVSGMLALLTGLRPALTPAQARDAIVLNPYHAIGGENAGASGTMIDACATIAQSTGTCTCSCTSAHASKASEYR